jgi:hypothetical protein
VDLVILNAGEQASDAVASSRYRDLAKAGHSVDPVTASQIAALAAATQEKVSAATVLVIRRCTSLGYAPTKSQLQQIRTLFVTLFAPSTTTTIP